MSPRLLLLAAAVATAYAVPTADVAPRSEQQQRVEQHAQPAADVPSLQPGAVPAAFAADDADRSTGSTEVATSDVTSYRAVQEPAQPVPPAQGSKVRLRGQGASPAPGLAFWPAFVHSIGMIIATELGDKTFFIAAILAMKHERCGGGREATRRVLMRPALATAVPGFASLTGSSCSEAPLARSR